MREWIHGRNHSLSSHATSAFTAGASRIGRSLERVDIDR